MGPVASRNNQTQAVGGVVTVWLIHKGAQGAGLIKSQIQSHDFDSNRTLQNNKDGTWNTVDFLNYYRVRDHLRYISLLRSEPATTVKCSGVMLVGGDPACMLFLLSNRSDCSFGSYILIEPAHRKTPIDLIVASFLFPHSYHIAQSWYISIFVNDKILTAFHNTNQYRGVVVMFANTTRRKILQCEHLDFKFDTREGQMKQLNIGYMILSVLQTKQASWQEGGRLTTLPNPQVTDEYGIFVASKVTDSEYHFIVFDKPNQCISRYISSYMTSQISIDPKMKDLGATVEMVKTAYQRNPKLKAWLDTFNPTEFVSEVTYKHELYDDIKAVQRMAHEKLRQRVTDNQNELQRLWRNNDRTTHGFADLWTEKTTN